MSKRLKLLNLIPALWASLFDISITTIFQPKAYWSGDLTKGNEGNPIGALFMAGHQYGLFIISAIWILIIILLGFYLPEKIRRVFLVFCLIAHSYAASTWLSSFLHFWFAIAFILFNSILLCVIDNVTDKERQLERKLNQVF